MSIMIACHQVQQYYGAEQVLSSVTLEIHSGRKVGLIGMNGAGKTTLFRLLSGQERPYQGDIHIQKGAKVGYLAQVPDYAAGITVMEVLRSSFSDLLALQQRMEELALRMSDTNQSEQQLDKSHSRLWRRDGTLRACRWI